MSAAPRDPFRPGPAPGQAPASVVRRGRRSSLYRMVFSLSAGICAVFVGAAALAGSGISDALEQAVVQKAERVGRIRVDAERFNLRCCQERFQGVGQGLASLAKSGGHHGGKLLCRGRNRNCLLVAGFRHRHRLLFRCRDHCHAGREELAGLSIGDAQLALKPVAHSKARHDQEDFAWLAGLSPLSLSRTPQDRYLASSARAVARIARGGFAVVCTGLQAQSIPIATLAPQGLPGCTSLLLSMAIELAFPVAGRVETAIAVPNNATLLGLPIGARIKVRAGDHAGFAVYVQSTSVNRRLVAGTTLLYRK